MRRRNGRPESQIFNVRGMYTDKRIQANVVEYIFLALGEDCFSPHGKLEPVLRDAQKNLCPRTPTRTLRNWYDHYLLYGETQAETRMWGSIGVQRENIRDSQWQQTDTDSLRGIVVAKPYLYLDEIRERLGFSTNRWWDASTIWRKVRDELNMSLQVVSMHAKQRDEEERQRYREGLQRWLVHVNQLVFLDETHKGRSASRRRRHWAVRNHSPIVHEKFNSNHSRRYSMIAACDVNGFIKSTCKCYSREPDAFGNARTVDSEQFQDWLAARLVPLLTPYRLFGKRSIVVLDNASIHHSDEVVALIKATGAKVLYLAPYSPDMNPIELMFGQYKKALKRNEGRNFDEAHVIALCSVSPTIARNFFRKCGLPGCEKMEGSELKTVAAIAAVHFFNLQMHVVAKRKGLY